MLVAAKVLMVLVGIIFAMAAGGQSEEAGTFDKAAVTCAVLALGLTLVGAFL